MKDIKRLSWLAFAFVVIALIVFSLGSWAEEVEISNSRSLVLDVYADDAGKALVTGYTNGIEGLSFLNSSEYLYDNDSLQLYAVTNALTWKSGDEWEIRLPAVGTYGEYHVTFYLSEDVQLSNITGSSGLDYLVSSSIDSFVVEFHGYDVTSPSAAVRYRQPLNGGQVEAEAPPLQQEGSSSVPLILVGAIIVLFIVVAAFKFGRSAESGPPRGEGRAQEAKAAVSDLKKEGSEEVREALVDIIPAETPQSATSENETTSTTSEGEMVGASISAEMAAVMDTLTERERSVLEALIKHEGKMTQADIRYETGIPKSSLTGIIISLERRNIVTKKEWGRTNVIELSERLRGEG
jgi:uncharacterized membrane protein